MPLITITQDYGRHGYYVAKEVAKRLHLKLYDDETLRKAAGNLGVKSENLKALKEEVPGFFERFIGSKPEIYLDVLQGVVYQMSSENNGVIVGHGSQVLLKDFGCALHVRIVSPDDKRIRYFMEKKNCDENSAHQLVQARDKQAKDFFQYAFKMDINDPFLYDLIINTEKVSVETAISHIVDLAKSNEITECSLTALTAMKSRALELKIHAKLIMADVIMTGITVEVNELNTVHVQGVINDNAEQVKIISVLDAIPELKNADVKITVVPLTN